jgi:hypothetical protein
MPLYPDTGEHERMQRSSRKSQRVPLGIFSAIVMIFIIILTFVLLLSGVYLASAMGIINVPWFTDTPVSAQPVPAQGHRRAGCRRAQLCPGEPGGGGAWLCLKSGRRSAER